MGPFLAQKQKAAVGKYQKLNPTAHTIDIDPKVKIKSKTKCGKLLKAIVNCTGWLIIACLFAAAVVCTYKVVLLYLKDSDSVTTAVQADQCTIDENNRFDCWPEKNGATQQSCQARGCCWQPSSKPETAPYCYFSSNYSGYTASDIQYSQTGVTFSLKRSTNSFIPNDVLELKGVVEYQSETRIRFKLFDPNVTRYEVPLDVPSGGLSIKAPQFNVTIQSDPFNIMVTRISTGVKVFDTTGTAPLIFADQYLQIATSLSTKYLYGLGEHRGNFLQDISTWRRLMFWNTDSSPIVDKNGYGTHPFFLNLEPATGNGPPNAHGVFLLNSNAGEVAFQPYGSNGALTYRMLGGILDFFFVLGDDPLSVATEYTSIVGRPYFPPFWSLGFHLCKYGIQNDSELQNMINRNRQAEMPYDVQWTDIDYMDAHKDWTYDKSRYAKLPDIVKDLHDNQQRYILMADPAISSEQARGTYPPFDDGKKLDIFIKNASGDILIGKVWPGFTAYPDFFHPQAVKYWYDQAKNFHDVLPFDGLWIDMNEPSSFVDGSAVGCTNSSLDNPPYLPPINLKGPLYGSTVCPSAEQYLSTHYNLHNMYGWSQANVTRRVLELLYVSKRSPIITRSSYAGTGALVGHWLGDNHSTFEDLYYSIIGILNFNLFAIPQIGADICGFIGTTTPELCTRWHQLGAFYPFMRNHADIKSPVQDPGSFQKPYQDYMRAALQMRYRLLAVLYTGFFRATMDGLPIVRPLFYMYPGTEGIDRQFMWNDQLLVSPVVDQGATSVSAFIPDDMWYDFFYGTALSVKGQNVTLNAPLDHINVHLRGGSILPLLPVTQRTDQARKEKFELLVAPDAQGDAAGELFWDDGETLDTIFMKQYSLFKFKMENSTTLTGSAELSGYKPAEGIKLGLLTFYGVQLPNKVTVNGKVAPFEYTVATKILSVKNLDEDLLQALTVVVQYPSATAVDKAIQA